MNRQDTKSMDFSMPTGPRPRKRWHTYVPRKRLTRRQRREQAAADRVRSLLVLRTLVNEYRRCPTPENSYRLDATCYTHYSRQHGSYSLKSAVAPVPPNVERWRSAFASLDAINAVVAEMPRPALTYAKADVEGTIQYDRWFTRTFRRTTRKHRRQARRARINRRGWA